MYEQNRAHGVLEQRDGGEGQGEGLEVCGSLSNGARVDVSAAPTKPEWLCRGFIRRARQANSQVGAPGAARGGG